MIEFEINFNAWRTRVWQMLPGLLSWGTLIGLSVLAIVIPFWIAIFIIAFDIYILVRTVYMSVHLIYAYRQLKRNEQINWEARLTQLPGWQRVHQVIVLPTYNESLTVLRTTLTALAASDYPMKHLHVVVGFEERAGAAARERARVLDQEFGHQFGTFLTSWHPDGLAGERRVKSANASWAVRKMEEKLATQHISTDEILVSNFDCDTVVTPAYFSYVSYVYLTHPDRYHVSYQPIPIYNNNVWDAPAFSRVIATGSTFWQMIESTRPERLVTFSSHTMTLRALRAVGYWQTDVISEDSRIFWQCLLHYHGHYRTQPLYITVSMDAALSTNWLKTLANQYKQKRRWAWGIENFPYLAEGFWDNKKISWRIKSTYLFRTLEGHLSWATAPIIVAGLGWLPIFFGGPSFHTTVLSYSLPYVTRTLMSVAMLGLVVSASLSLLLLPRRPRHYRRWRYIGVVLQWTLVPLIATLLSAFPALDAETRLLLGRDLEFNVMEKTRREHVH